MTEIKSNEEMCERCGKVDVLEKMAVAEDRVLCTDCNDALVAQAEAAAEDFEPDTI